MKATAKNQILFWLH